jgi:hypothetical protein
LIQTVIESSATPQTFTEVGTHAASAVEEIKGAKKQTAITANNILLKDEPIFF